MQNKKSLNSYKTPSGSIREHPTFFKEEEEGHGYVLA